MRDYPFLSQTMLWRRPSANISTFHSSILDLLSGSACVDGVNVADCMAFADKISICDLATIPLIGEANSVGSKIPCQACNPAPIRMVGTMSTDVSLVVQPKYSKKTQGLQYRRSGLSRVEIEGFPLVLAPVARGQKS